MSTAGLPGAGGGLACCCWPALIILALVSVLLLLLFSVLSVSVLLPRTVGPTTEEST